MTYSPNLQELVYIIDKLISDQLLIREGMTFKLTEPAGMKLRKALEVRN